MQPKASPVSSCRKVAVIVGGKKYSLRITLKSAIILVTVSLFAHLNNKAIIGL